MKVNFPWKLKALGRTPVGTLNLGVICVNGILNYETVITKGISMDGKEVRSYY